MESVRHPLINQDSEHRGELGLLPAWDTGSSDCKGLPTARVRARRKEVIARASGQREPTRDPLGRHIPVCENMVHPRPLYKKVLPQSKELGLRRAGLSWGL